MNLKNRRTLSATHAALYRAVARLGRAIGAKDEEEARKALNEMDSELFAAFREIDEEG